MLIRLTLTDYQGPKAASCVHVVIVTVIPPFSTVGRKIQEVTRYDSAVQSHMVVVTGTLL